MLVDRRDLNALPAWFRCKMLFPCSSGYDSWGNSSWPCANGCTIYKFLPVVRLPVRCSPIALLSPGLVAVHGQGLAEGGIA